MQRALFVCILLGATAIPTVLGGTCSSSCTLLGSNVDQCLGTTSSYTSGLLGINLGSQTTFPNGCSGQQHQMLFQFTPSLNGVHTITMAPGGLTGSNVDISIASCTKVGFSSCNAGNINVTLDVGTEYAIMVQGAYTDIFTFVLQIIPPDTSSPSKSPVAVTHGPTGRPSLSPTLPPTCGGPACFFREHADTCLGFTSSYNSGLMGIDLESATTYPNPCGGNRHQHIFVFFPEYTGVHTISIEPGSLTGSLVDISVANCSHSGFSASSCTAGTVQVYLTQFDPVAVMVQGAGTDIFSFVLQIAPPPTVSPTKSPSNLCGSIAHECPDDSAYCCCGAPDVNYCVSSPSGDCNVGDCAGGACMKFYRNCGDPDSLVTLSPSHSPSSRSPTTPKPTNAPVLTPAPTSPTLAPSTSPTTTPVTSPSSAIISLTNAHITSDNCGLGTAVILGGCCSQSLAVTQTERELSIESTSKNCPGEVCFTIEGTVLDQEVARLDAYLNGGYVDYVTISVTKLSQHSLRVSLNSCYMDYTVTSGSIAYLGVDSGGATGGDSTRHPALGVWSVVIAFIVCLCA